jgi:AraC-like DNA-binding protein
MPSSEVRSFTDPDDYFAALRASRAKGVLTDRSSFRAELMEINFHRVSLHRGEETLPRVVSLTASPLRASFFFAAGPGQPAMHLNGMALSDREIVAWDLGGVARQHRSSAACQWGQMSLRPEDLATAAHAFIGRELSPPPFPHRVRPPAPILSRLRNLHEAAGHLAKTAPDILANPEVARAMEQALLHAIVACVATGEPLEVPRTHRHHRAVMHRLEEALQANPDEALYMADLCKAVRVSYPTLRASCQEHLGMSPKRYLWLRRMHLARGALRRADPETTTVTEIATNQGFWKLGRFSVAYRSLFGESPSTALHRPPDDPQTGENAGSPWQFTKSA